MNITCLIKIDSHNEVSLLCLWAKKFEYQEHSNNQVINLNFLS